MSWTMLACPSYARGQYQANMAQARDSCKLVSCFEVVSASFRVANLLTLHSLFLHRYYIVIACCVFARKSEWLRNACLAAALCFPAIAAIHGIVLAAVHVDSECSRFYP
jgi:hypothetical protein